MKELLRIDIQDGENCYSDFFIIDENENISEIVKSYSGFLREAKNIEKTKINEEEIKILNKFGVI